MLDYPNIGYCIGLTFILNLICQINISDTHDATEECESKETEDEEDDDCDEQNPYDGLPDMGSPFSLNNDNDPFFFHDDTAETITTSATESELVPDDMPFYANQEEDPEVAWHMYDHIKDED